MHHHMHHHHPSHHQPAIVPPSSSSAPLGQTYVHKYSYTLPGQGSYVKMSRTYHRPYLPSFVGTERFRSSSAFPAHDASNQRLKDHALLSSLSFLPDLLVEGICINIGVRMIEMTTRENKMPAFVT